MSIYKKLKPFISLVCAVAILISMFIPVVAADSKHITATTEATIQQGNGGACVVSIDSTENLASLELNVYYDPNKVQITDTYNYANCILYDNVINADNIQFNYIFDGVGTADKTELFVFYYQVLSEAETGNTNFQITVGEAYDSQLNDVSVSGSRCNFTITQTSPSHIGYIYGTEQVSTSVGKEFSLNYQISASSITSGSAVISYDPELFEVVSVSEGALLSDRVVDINTDFAGAVYVSFVGNKGSDYSDFITLNLRTIKNITQSAQIRFKAAELYDQDLNSITCSDFVSNVNIVYDSSYVGDVPEMKLDAAYSSENKQVTLVVSLEKDSHLGAGDFVVRFNPELVSYASSTKEFSPAYFNINDKKVSSGELKFHIVSLSDIVTEETVLKAVFDLKCCGTIDFTLEGSGLTNALTESIKMNFVDDSVKLVHKEVVVTGYAAGCYDAGLTEGKQCRVCGEILVVQEEIPAPGRHTFNSDQDPFCALCGEVRSVPMFRMYDPNSGEHFYTGSVEEREILVKAGWNYEGVGFNFPVVGNPVHRLYEPATGEHLYTMDEAEMERLLASGWNYEGVAFNSAPSTEIAQYRLHNPNGTRGAYHFTGDIGERDWLISLGWKYQGIGWYSCLR